MGVLGVQYMNIYIYIQLMFVWRKQSVSQTVIRLRLTAAEVGCGPGAYAKIVARWLGRC